MCESEKKKKQQQKANIETHKKKRTEEQIAVSLFDFVKTGRNIVNLEHASEKEEITE
jgi:hypothetical protein